MLSSRGVVVSNLSIVSVLSTAKARRLKLEACSKASREMTMCKKVSVRVRYLCEKQRKMVLAG